MAKVQSAEMAITVRFGIKCDAETSILAPFPKRIRYNQLSQRLVPKI
jgi:hypothetical protein